MFGMIDASMPNAAEHVDQEPRRDDVAVDRAIACARNRRALQMIRRLAAAVVQDAPACPAPRAISIAGSGASRNEV